MEFINRVLEYNNLLFNYALQLNGRDQEKASDLYQSTLLRLMENESKYTEQGTLKAYICAVMKNLHINNFRKSNYFEQNLKDYIGLNFNTPSKNEGETNLIKEDILNLIPKERSKVMRMKIEGYMFREILKKY